MTSILAVWIFAVALLAAVAGAQAVTARVLALPAIPDAWPLHERLLVAVTNGVLEHAPLASLVGPLIVAALGALRHRCGLTLRTERHLLLAWMLTGAAAPAWELVATGRSLITALATSLALGVLLASVLACAAIAAHLQWRLPTSLATRRAWLYAAATLLLSVLHPLWLVPPAVAWVTSRAGGGGSGGGGGNGEERPQEQRRNGGERRTFRSSLRAFDPAARAPMTHAGSESEKRDQGE